MPLLLGQGKRLPDLAVAGEEGRWLSGDGLEVGERVRGHHGGPVAEINEALNYLADTWLFAGAAVALASALTAARGRSLSRLLCGVRG